jgi:hypothetical protein
LRLQRCWRRFASESHGRILNLDGNDPEEGRWPLSLE